jgi:hypothetical protein|tara:strand:- start:3746 stop:4264 length:519 start_codon:yes stop_codon:yes gene_type:complete
MNTIYINIALRFIVLILAQGLVFNKFDFLGVYDPYISLVFILIFPVKISRISFLIISFFFGLSLDYFSNSLGLNATAFIIIAYLKPSIMNFVFGNFYDPYGVKMIKHYIIESTIYQKILYVFIIIFLHHLIIFSLESFSIDQILIVFKKTIYSSFLSFIFCFSFIYLFKNER